MCHCDSQYVGRTTKQLLSRVKEHVPLYVRNNTKLEKTPNLAIGRHLTVNQECLRNYRDDCFTILARWRNDFHLSVLEALHIMNKRPVLCVQKKFVYSTVLFWSVDDWFILLYSTLTNLSFAALTGVVLNLFLFLSLNHFHVFNLRAVPCDQNVFFAILIASFPWLLFSAI